MLENEPLRPRVTHPAGHHLESRTEDQQRDKHQLSARFMSTTTIAM